MASMLDKCLALIQYPLPHHLLSRVVYYMMRVEWEPFKNFLINTISKKYNIDISLAKHQDKDHYPHFNSFFTRELREDARPIVEGDENIACPVDGTISQYGEIRGGRVFQAKGHDYDLEMLLGGHKHLHDQFLGGEFSTIYLSPRDYHRIHMPVTGKLKEMVYVPGRLFSVSPSTTRAIPSLFARNERLITVFETEHGPMAMILVGAIFVAGIETVWTGNFGDKMFRSIQRWDYENDDTLPDITLNKGEEMGRFNMGSTVILLFGKKQMQWINDKAPEQSVQMGQCLGHYLDSSEERVLEGNIVNG